MKAIKTLWASAAALAIVLVYAAASAAPVRIGYWYLGLKLPSFALSSGAMTALWAVCYTCDVVVLCRAIVGKKTSRSVAVIASGVAGALWSFTFFSLHSLEAALVFAITAAALRIAAAVLCFKDALARIVAAVASAAALYCAVLAYFVTIMNV